MLDEEICLSILKSVHHVDEGVDALFCGLAGEVDTCVGYWRFAGISVNRSKLEFGGYTRHHSLHVGIKSCGTHMTGDMREIRNVLPASLIWARSSVSMSS